MLPIDWISKHRLASVLTFDAFDWIEHQLLKETNMTKCWRFLRKLDKRKMRSYPAAIEYIHKIALAVDIQSVSDIAISPETEKYLDKLLDKAISESSIYKKSSTRYKTQAAMERLNSYPTTIDCPDFTIYTKEVSAC